MKSIFIRMKVILTLMLALCIFFGAAASGTAHAATTKFASGTAHTAIAAPNTSAVDCAGRTDFFQIYRMDGSEICFADAGDWPFAITNVHYFCPGNNAGFVTISLSDGTSVSQPSFDKGPGCSFPFSGAIIWRIHIN